MDRVSVPLQLLGTRGAAGPGQNEPPRESQEGTLGDPGGLAQEGRTQPAKRVPTYSQQEVDSRPRESDFSKSCPLVRRVGTTLQGPPAALTCRLATQQNAADGFRRWIRSVSRLLP